MPNPPNWVKLKPGVSLTLDKRWGQRQTADLHLDIWRHAARDPFSSALPALGAVEALVVAGDLANDPLRNWPKALARLSMLMDPRRIYILPGNHDYYHFRLDGDERLRGMVEAAGMNWAQKAVFEFGNVRFLCVTLWTDFLLTGDEVAAKNMASRAMNDYHLIKQNEPSDRLLPHHTAEIHADHLAWLKREMELPHEGRTVIVTHHGPSPSASGPIDQITPAFVSNLDAWILNTEPDLWLFGHTHRHLSGQVGRTPVVNISLGYPSEVPQGNTADILLRGLVDTNATRLVDLAL